MKVKSKPSKINPIYLEKKNSPLFIMDLFIQRNINFEIRKSENKFLFNQIPIIFDIIKTSLIYPRIKSTRIYYNKTLFISNQNSFSFLIRNCKDYKIQSKLISNIEQSKKIENDKVNIKDNNNNVSNKKDDKNNIKESNIEIESSNNEENIINNNQDSPIKIIENINKDLKNIVKSKKPIKADKLKIIPISKDGNCFYRCLSYFLLNNDEFFEDIKNMIIEWIENNYKIYVNFFGDDDKKKKTKEELAKSELEYIKSKDSWGSDYTISIACILFNLEIAIYYFDGKDSYKQYHYFYNEDESKKDSNDRELLLLCYHNNNHFNILYSINENNENVALYESLKSFNVKKINYKNKVKKIGVKFARNYVEIKNKSSTSFYDEIYEFLSSIESYSESIKALELQNPNWHYNQILSKFELKYPERILGKENKQLEKRRNFRKQCENYKINNNGRLCIINPLKKEDEKNKLYLIPYKHEKDIIIKDYHDSNNHAGKTSSYQYILKGN